jgi:hypothetical protein
MPLLVALCCISEFIMLVLLGLRVYTRHTMSQRGLGVDDALIVLAGV